MRVLDAWSEILSTLARNRLRTFLTALSVAWGIFMLVLLLAAGDGLQRGVEYDFRDDATNSVWIRPGRTSIPHQGLVPGRPIHLQTADVEALVRDIPGIEHITGRFYLWGERPVSHAGRKGSFDVRGCHPDHQYLERSVILEGRFINRRDVEEARKVCVISEPIRRTLFEPDDPGIGSVIKVSGVNFLVVGIYDDAGGEGELEKIYVPISAAQRLYGGEDRVHAVMFTTGDATVEESRAMESSATRLLAERHRFSLEDPRAVHITNNLERFTKVRETFAWIRAFVWFVGIGTLFAGMVGVSNIMLISVQERTAEIGIRKAVGATPGSVVALVLQESLFITAVAGYGGLLAGTVVVELVQRNLGENPYIRDPRVDFGTAIAATIALIVAGGLAGLLPALRAATIRPVAALRQE